MSNYIESTKRKLRSAITQLCDTSGMFVKDPGRDFTRKRKLPLSAVISVRMVLTFRFLRIRMTQDLIFLVQKTSSHAICSIWMLFMIYFSTPM